MSNHTSKCLIQSDTEEERGLIVCASLLACSKSSEQKCQPAMILCMCPCTYLGNVEQPEEFGKGRIISVITNAGEDSVAVAVGEEEGLNGHVRAQHDLGHVVDELEGVGVHGGDAGGLHDGRTDQDEADVDGSDGGGRGKVGEEPALGMAAELLLRVGPCQDGIPDGLQSVAKAHVCCIISLFPSN